MFIIEKSANDDGISFVGGCSPQARPAAIRQCIPACRKPFSYCTQVSHMLESSISALVAVFYICNQMFSCLLQLKQQFHMPMIPSRGICRSNPSYKEFLVRTMY